jgi:beta-glucosidase
MAKLKHLFANSNENTRTSSSSDFDERLMREYYALPFRRAFLEAGVKGYMSAYNAWNGVPMVVNPVLKNVVSKEWGADWNVSPDAGALGHVVDGHHYYKTMDEVYVNALKVGVNNLGGGAFGRATGPAMPDVMKQALADGRITESDIDAAIKGKFKTVIRLGLLDPPARNPYSRIGAAGEPEPWTTERHKTVARDVARESVVLLKNSPRLLPLSRQSMKSIAVIGPRADNVLSDFYTGTTPYSVSVLQGIRNTLGSGATVNYAPNNDNDAAVTAAKSSDIAVVVVGNDPMCGSANPGEAFNPDGSTKPCGDPGEGREGRDRESLNLAAAQETLIEQVLAANPKTIVVLVSSFPYAINWAEQNVPAILHMTHAAQDQGTAIAEVLFGDYNPSGRLVQTWPMSVDQLPPLMDYDIRKGRTYLYFKGKPLYPFGYGLSYATFAYSNLRLSSARLARNGAITVSVDVKNTGKRDGAEVVQLYVQHPQSKVTRPLNELKGFQRVALKTNETRTVQIPLTAASLAWWNEPQHAFEVESEPIRIFIGRSSADVELQGTLTVN